MCTLYANIQPFYIREHLQILLTVEVLKQIPLRYQETTYSSIYICQYDIYINLKQCENSQEDNIMEIFLS